VLVSDYDRDKKWIRTLRLNPQERSVQPEVIWSRSVQDRYADPGTPVTRTLPSGHHAIQHFGDGILLAGDGASPQGDHPFLDKFNLTSKTAERLFHCEDGYYEPVVAILDDDGTRLLTRRQSPADPPNYYIRDRKADTVTAITKFKDPAPQIRGITKRRVTYLREDGVDLSFTLYLPPGYKEGEGKPLPTVMWAYPREFNSAKTAGQISGSTKQFTLIDGPSHLFFLLAGYAILDGATLPVVGDPETANDTYIEQIVAGAKAAIDKAAELGVTDPKRVGVGGHSYGAFMTANLLAHSELFKAGLARSGAYNRTLTPFGFQAERRTFWEAPQIYFKLSPFMAANKINEPLLLIHGEADNNSGTFPVQSERMYHAIKGNGGVVRLVMLPHESHGYAARESIEHVLAEMIDWFDKYVKQ
jgi:dipeptidyl aminopeptidase/acylaminoacyl peptidase